MIKKNAFNYFFLRHIALFHQPNPLPVPEILQPQRLSEVVDIGANPLDGGDPPYKRMLEARLCSVTGFEPQEQAFAALLQKNDQHERYLPYAVGDGESHILNICRASGMTSFLEPDAKTLKLFKVLKPLGEVVNREPLQTQRLDDITEIEHLDFLKIDIQGGELDVFKSGRQRLSEAVAIQTEVSFVALYQQFPFYKC